MTLVFEELYADRVELLLMPLKGLKMLMEPIERSRFVLIRSNRIKIKMYGGIGIDRKEK